VALDAGRAVLAVARPTEPLIHQPGRPVMTLRELLLAHMRPTEVDLVIQVMETYITDLLADQRRLLLAEWLRKPEPEEEVA